MAGLLGDIHGTYQRANPMEGLLRGLQAGGQFGLALRQQRMAEEQAKAEQEQRARAEKVQRLAMTIEANNKMKNNPAMQKALGQAATQMMVELGMLPEGTNYVHNEEAKDYFKALGDLKRAYLDQGDIESWQRGVMETTSHFAEQGKDVQSQAGALEKQAAESTLAQLGEMTRAGETNMPELKSSDMALEEQKRLLDLAERQDFGTASKYRAEMDKKKAAGEYKPPQPWGFVTSPDGSQKAVGFDPNSKKVVAYDMPYSGQVTPFALGRTPASEVKSGTALDTLKDNVNRIKSAYDPQYVGFVKGRAKQLQASTVGGIKEEQAAFYADVNDIADMLLRARSGAQINEQEYERLSRLVPTPNLPPATFQARLKRFEVQLDATMRNQRARLQQGGYIAPTGKTNSTTPPAAKKSKFKIISVE